MKNRILADTTAWIEFFRGKSKVADRFEMLLIENAVCTCGVVMFEVLQGIKSEGEKNKILSILATLPYFEMMKKLWQSAAELSLSLKKNGVNLPLSDILIAAIAVENDLSIYTLDNHFTLIPNLKLYSF
ncbi:MAG: PIN domain-containing protein [Deltaproteobacteria bacterium]|nr:PIN domain-containing protein [Deltaproteobacteria bacterium]